MNRFLGAWQAVGALFLGACVTAPAGVEQTVRAGGDPLDWGKPEALRPPEIYPCSPKASEEEIRASAWRLAIAQVPASSDAFLHSERRSLLNADSLLAPLYEPEESGSRDRRTRGITLTIAEQERLIANLYRMAQEWNPAWSRVSVEDMVVARGEDPPLRTLADPALRIRWEDDWIRIGAFKHRFSNMGFSPDLRQAVVYLESLGGPLFMQADLILLERNEREWRVVARLLVWVT